MNNSLKKITIGILCVSTSTFAFTGSSFAKAISPQQQAATSTDRITATTKHKILKEKIQPVSDEAAEIAAETQKAMAALGKKDTKEAAALLQGVSSKLDGVLAKNPGMALVPVSVETDVYDFEGTNKDVTNAIDDARDLLKNGKLQNARQLLSGLASEIQVTTTSIPLGTYPAAIKQIIPLINEGKIDQAAVDLNNVLDTLVIDTEVMPLPVLRAEELLTVAADLEHTGGLSKDKSRAEIQKFTDAAKRQLKLAELLGYGGKDDYKDLHKEIDALDDALFSEKSAGVWQQIKDRFAGLKEAINRIGHPAH